MIFTLFCGMFVGLLTIANVIAFKVIDVGGLYAPAAVLAYALTFLISDVLAEVYGKEKVKEVVRTGFFTQIIILLLVRLAIWWPGAPFFTHQKEFALVLGANLRLIIASLMAYLVSQYHDIWAFYFWKEKTKGKHLWLRNNLSTWVSQLMDTVIFITIAFYGVIPILPLIIGQYTIKIVTAALDTPLIYILVYYIRKVENK